MLVEARQIKAMLVTIAALALVATAAAYQSTPPTPNVPQRQVQLAVPSPTPTFEQRISILSPLVVRVSTGPSSGTGLILDSRLGTVVTAYHVVENWLLHRLIVVDFPNGTSTSAELIYRDPERDLAWLRLSSTKGLPDTAIGASVDFRSLRPGQQIVRFGYGSVTGELQGFAPVATGIVSSVFRNDRVIQLDASAIPGDSGGPVFTADGQFIGVVTSKLTGQFVEGVTYAVGYPPDVDADFLSARVPIKAPTPTPTPTQAPTGDWVFSSDGDLAGVASLNANPYDESMLLLAFCTDDGDPVFLIDFGVELDWEYESWLSRSKSATIAWSVDSTYPRFTQEVTVFEDEDDGLNSEAALYLGRSTAADKAYRQFAQDIRSGRLLVVNAPTWQWGGLTAWFPIAGVDYVLNQMSCGR